MRTTILFSAVDEVSTRFADLLAGLSEFLAQQFLPLDTPATVKALAEHLSGNDAFRDDLASMLRVVCSAEPAISYLELLALLLVATIGQEQADQLSADPACEADVRETFQFIVEMRRTAEVDLEPLAADLPASDPHVDFASSHGLDGERRPAESPHSVFPIASKATSEGLLDPPGRGETQAGLARALALVADDDLPVQAAYADAYVGPGEPVQPSPLQTPLSGSVVADPVVLLSRAPERPTWSFTWGVTLCGVLLGLLLGIFLQRHDLPRAAAHAAADPSPATIPMEAETSPALAPASQFHRSLARAGHRASMGLNPTSGPDSRDTPLRFDRPVTLESRPHNGVLRPSHDPARPATIVGIPSNSPAVVTSSLATRPPKVSDAVLNTRPGNESVRLGSSQRAGRVLLGSAGIMAANLISSPAPSYPAQASAAQVQGEVVVEAIVGRDGDVIQTRVVSGPPMLRDAALRAVGRWRYRPYEVDGEVAEIATTARLDFRLDP